MTTTTTTLNLTQHLSTQDQQAAGVFDLPEATRRRVGELLTFDEPPYPTPAANTR